MAQNGGKARALPSRLGALADMLGVGPVADIGCDHGLLSAYLASRGMRVIAIDISEASLQKVRRLTQNRGLNNLEVRRGDGLAALTPGEVKECVIAGLGGEEMARMLQASPQVAHALDTLVLQPMQGQAYLREWLQGNGYAVADERLVRDGRLFEALKVHPGEAQSLPEGWPEGFYDIGYIPVLRGDEEAGNLIKRRLGIFRRQLAEAKDTPEWLVWRVEAYTRVLEIYEEVGGRT